MPSRLDSQAPFHAAVGRRLAAVSRLRRTPEDAQAGVVLRTIRGAGLGLAIVARIQRAHGGTVNVVSNPGRGTVFRLRYTAA